MRVRRGMGLLAAMTAAVMATGTVYVAAEPAQASRQPEEMSASATARATGKRIEVAGAGSETRQVFAEPDGSYTMELTTQPVRVRKDGAWVRPDPTLQRRPDGMIGPVAAQHSIAFSGGGSTAPLVRLADGDRRIELGWPGALPTPVRSGDTATYPEVLPGVDLRVRATAQGFSKLLVVKTREAAKDPRLARIELRLTTAGLTVAGNDYGGLSATDSKGRVLFESSKVEMWDSAGTRRAIGEVELAAGRLVVIPDQKLLEDPAAAYPIMIDPDFHPPGAGWTKVFSGYPNSSYWNGGGDDGLAKVGYCGWAGCNGIGVTRSFFQFDISALRGAQIFGGEFNMHEVYAPSCSPRGFEVWQVGPIGGGTTWNNQPGGWWGPLGSPNVAYGYNSSCGPNWVGVAAGQSVINRLNDGSNVATFLMKAADEGDKFAWKKFDAGSLIVHYNWPPNHPANLWANAGQGPSLGCPSAKDVAFTPSTRPTLHATLSDRDGQNLEAQFEWWHWGGSGPVGSARTAFQPNGTAHAVTIPNGAFGDGAAISWRARAGDGHIWGPWSSFCQITVDKTPPGRPTVTSTDYPEDQVAGYVGKTGAFTVSSADSDVIGFQWSLNFQDLPVVDVNSPYFVHATNGVATIRATPPREGRNDLYVRAVDRAHNVSSVYQKPDGNGGWVPGGYGFTVGSAVPPPVGYWPLDGFHLNTGAPDASGKGHHGTVTGIYPASGAAWTTGRVGDALRFSGASNGYVSTAGGSTVDTADTFSVAAWVRLDTVDNVMHAAVSQDGNRVFGFFLGYVGDQRRFTFRMVPGDSENIVTVRANSTAEPKPGVWTHLTGVYDVGNKQMRLYVNGALQGTAALNTPWTSGGAVQVGRAKYAGNHTDYWPGAIDEVKVWNRMLAESEIHQLAGTPTIEEAFYPLDEGTGTRTADVSGNYRTGTLTGGATWLPGVVGDGAVGFDGVDDAITTTQQAVRTDGSFTVTARARLDAANGRFQTVVSQDGPNSSGFALQYSPTQGKWVMAVSPADAANPAWQTVYSAVPAQAGEWVNLAGVYDAAKAEIRLYVNGAEHIAAAQVNAPVAGNLVIGRAKQSGAGGLVAYFGGRIDDVHVYTGVRSKEEIIADSLTPVTARPTVYSGQLSRFVGHDGRHFVTTGPVPGGQRFEWSLGLLAPQGAADTRMLYSCRYGGGQFVSLQVDCEGQTLLGEIGLVYRNPPVGIPSQAIYRCLVVATGDHFNSPHEDCEGHRNEGRQGYTQAYQYLVRYAKQYSPHDHITTSTAVAAGYRAEGVQGIVATSHETNVIGLMSCYDGTDEFVSNDPECEGKTVRWWIGNAWLEPPAHAQGSLQLWACRTSPTGERFTSLDEFCEGRTVIGSLGYVVTSF